MPNPKLSVNVNKIALLRNSRGQNQPDLLVAIDKILKTGGDGITVHPRMDQRHILFRDPAVIAQHLAQNHPEVEFNIEILNGTKKLKVDMGQQLCINVRLCGASSVFYH